MNPPAITTCLNRIRNFNERHFHRADQRVAEIVSRSARVALEAIAGSNASYHDVDHTVLVTLAGQSILEGLHLFSPSERENADPLAELIRAADLIGQLGDPQRRQKCSALFREFEESGLNARLGYQRPEDIISDTARFYRKAAAPRIQKALACLRLTREGSDWVANLQSNVGERIL